MPDDSCKPVRPAPKHSGSGSPVAFRHSVPSCGINGSLSSAALPSLCTSDPCICLYGLPSISYHLCSGLSTYILYENTGTEVNSAPGWPSNAPRRPRLWATGYTPFLRACFHLLQVEINIHPQHTSARPASAAHAHPGMHKNNSSNPALMNTHPSIFQIPSAEGWGGSHWP